MSELLFHSQKTSESLEKPLEKLMSEFPTLLTLYSIQFVDIFLKISFN